jgi:hypothetical protein
MRGVAALLTRRVEDLILKAKDPQRPDPEEHREAMRLEG